MNKTLKDRLTSFTIILLALLLTLVSLKTFEVTHTEQKSAYMDEIFHAPQAQLYCKNKWTEWNPKITTLPGLYLISYAVLQPFQIFGYDFCSLYALRLLNIVATILNFFLAVKICLSLDKKYKLGCSRLIQITTALNITIFPPLYFFSFLYYTDVWSMTFVLLMYQAHLSQNRFLETAASIMAILMRQTNVIWVGLMIIDDIWNVLSTNNKRTPAVQDYKFTINIFKTLLADYLMFKKKSGSLCTLIKNIISKTYHSVIVCGLFIGFVIFNGSIVLGDKKAHAATFHPMQNLYFLDFTAFFGLPFFLFEAISLLRRPPNIFLTILLVGLCAGLSEVNKLEHHYLLADNRHLAFYIWKRLFNHSLLRRMIIPTYVLSGIILVRLVEKRCHFMFLVALWICTVLNLTPQYLFELRYFIIPFSMFRFHFKQNKLVFLETAFYIILNVAVFYLFLNRPFEWPSEPGIKQRFIW